MRILVFDNYDSFTYNLVQLIEEISDGEVEVHRNDRIGMEEIAGFDKILISPGPGLPAESGLLMPLLQTYATTKDILGVCLGHQAIAEYFGATLFNMPQVMHGVATLTTVTEPNDRLFRDLPGAFMTGRYHSWSVEKNGFPESLVVTAEDGNGEIMAFSHRKYNIRGVQFHPESILTEHGKQLIQNWLQ